MAPDHSGRAPASTMSAAARNVSEDVFPYWNLPVSVTNPVRRQVATTWSIGHPSSRMSLYASWADAAAEDL